MITCRKCNKNKRTEDFYKGHSRCKTCDLKSMKEYRAANPETVRAAQMNWRVANEGHTYLDSSTGYVLYVGVKHPAAREVGITGYHRIVLWDKLNGQDTPCNWCGTELKWGENLTADHLNWNRSDNRPENLVASCRTCNIKRRKPVAKKRCAYDTCERYAHSRGYCQGHATQRRKGQTIRPLQERTTQAIRAGIVFDVQNGMTVTGIAKKYNLNFGTVSKIYAKEAGHTVRDWRNAQKAVAA